MDQVLRTSLERIHKQIEKLKKAEDLYGELQASEKSLFAELYLKADSKLNVETRKNEVYASKDWRDFAKGLAIAESNKNRERRTHELLLKAFDAEYLTYKIENAAISREK